MWIFSVFLSLAQLCSSIRFSRGRFFGLLAQKLLIERLAPGGGFLWLHDFDREEAMLFMRSFLVDHRFLFDCVRGH